MALSSYLLNLNDLQLLIKNRREENNSIGFYTTK